MCGIAGQVSIGGRPPRTEQVLALTERIRHRGPDDSGVWTSAEEECVLGHARLSIIDLSPLGHQPMLDKDTGNCICFNGEIYNFQSLRQELEDAGDVFSSNSDTEVLLLLYRRYGPDCLSRLRGMFAFAIWDEPRKRLFFARDRVGKKPFNFAVTAKGMIFCSEIDPLAKHEAVAADLDEEALELFFQLQYIPAPWTIYKSIRKLPPGHFGIYDADGLTIRKYWELDYRSHNTWTEDDALDAFEEKLTEAVRLRMVSDVPLGALLSGGVDSSIVVALMAKLSAAPIRTFSIGFDEEKFNELPYAQQAANICRTQHVPEIAKGEVKEMLPLLARHYGEPYGDSSAVPSFMVCRAARKHVTVVMNGDGGDELLGGYSRYGLSKTQLCTASLTPSIIPAERRADLAIKLSTARTIPSRILRRLVVRYCWPELQSITMYSEFWNDEERKRLVPSSSTVLARWRQDWLKAASDHSRNAIDSMLWYDNHTYLPGDLLAKMDIASMHCGLETRSPLLDHEVIEFCARLPVDMKVHQGIGKYLLKRLAERYFPQSLVHRPKMGFGIPRAAWLMGPLRDLLEATLRDRDLMEPLSLEEVERALERFIRGDSATAGRMWILLMFGLWRQQCAPSSRQL